MVKRFSVTGKNCAGEGGARAEGGLERERRTTKHPREKSLIDSRVIWLDLLLGPEIERRSSTELGELLLTELSTTPAPPRYCLVLDLSWL